MNTSKDSGGCCPPPDGTPMCHFRDADSKTIREIMRWSVMECPELELTNEIQQLGTRLKLLISRQPNVKGEGKTQTRRKLKQATKPSTNSAPASAQATSIPTVRSGYASARNPRRNATGGLFPKGRSATST